MKYLLLPILRILWVIIVYIYVTFILSIMIIGFLIWDLQLPKPKDFEVETLGYRLDFNRKTRQHKNFDRFKVYIFKNPYDYLLNRLPTNI